MASDQKIPQDFRLPFELQPNESVIVFSRRHWIFIWPRIVFLLCVAAIPIIGAWLIVSWAIDRGGVVNLVLGAASILWFAFWAFRSYLLWFRYQNDVWVVTNQRIIDSIRKHWLHHQMSSADLVDVEDMRIIKQGLLSTALNYGDVQCQTAGVQQNFVLHNVPNPTQVLTIVDAARDSARRELGQNSIRV